MDIGIIPLIKISKKEGNKKKYGLISFLFVKIIFF